MKRSIRLLLFATSLFGPPCPSALAAADKDEGIADIKAAYLYHFATFTQWPKGVNTMSRKEIRLCVLGEDDVAAQLRLLDGKELDEGYVLRVAVVRREQLSRICNMVFIGESNSFPSEQAWVKLHGEPILWVSDQAGFAQNGGMIEMFLRDDKIRMRINLGAVRSSGIALSSKLLRLADIVDAP